MNYECGVFSFIIHNSAFIIFFVTSFRNSCYRPLRRTLVLYQFYSASLPDPALSIFEPKKIFHFFVSTGDKYS